MTFKVEFTPEADADLDPHTPAPMKRTANAK